MCTIIISNILAQNPDLTQAGAVFYDQLISAFTKSERVVVDMTDATSLPSIFLNVSIGRIIDELGIDVLKSKVSFAHINRSQAQRLQDYLAKFA